MQETLVRLLSCEDSPGERKGYPLPVFWPGDFHGLAHGVAKSWTWLSDFHFTFTLSLYCPYDEETFILLCIDTWGPLEPLTYLPIDHAVIRLGQKGSLWRILIAAWLWTVEGAHRLGMQHPFFIFLYHPYRIRTLSGAQGSKKVMNSPNTDNQKLMELSAEDRPNIIVMIFHGNTLLCPMSESLSRKREGLQDNATHKKGSLLLTRVRAPAVSSAVVRGQITLSPSCYTNL